jgi:hypothetical protein
VQKSDFRRQNALLLAENREQNPPKRGRRDLFSFREMSDVKGLARIFLPTPMAREGCEILTAQKRSSVQATFGTLFRFGTM